MIIEIKIASVYVPAAQLVKRSDRNTLWFHRSTVALASVFCCYDLSLLSKQKNVMLLQDLDYQTHIVLYMMQN